MDGDWTALGAAIRAERTAQGLSREALAERAQVSPGTVKNLERGGPTGEGYATMPDRLPDIVRALNLPEGWHLAKLGLPHTPHPGAPRPSAAPATPARGTGLIDPYSTDPVIRELSSGPVSSDYMREELIRLYLEDKAEMERRARLRAAQRVMRLAQADAASLPPGEATRLKLNSLSELNRKLALDDERSNTDTAGHERDSA